MGDSNTTTPASASNASDGSSSRWVSARAIVGGLILGGTFLGLALRGTSFREFIDTVQTANSSFIYGGIGLYALYLVTRSSRWSLLLAERTSTRPFALLFRAVTWGTAANTLIPHSGEILRSVIVRKPLNISAASVLGAIAAERLYDFATVIALTCATLFFFKGAPTLLQSALLGLSAMGAAVLLALTLLSLKNPIMLRIVGLIFKFLPRRFEGKAQTLVDELSAGIRAAFSNPHLAWIGVLSLIQWLFIVACIYLSIEAFSLGLSPWLAFIVLPLTIAGLTLPTAPAYLGTIQVCFLAALVPFGVSNEVALAASLAYLGIITLPVVCVSAVWYLLYILTRKTAL